MIYGGSHLAESFRTVRRNTIQVAEHKIEHLSSVSRATFMGYMQKCGESAATLTTKQQIVDALRKEGDTRS